MVRGFLNKVGIGIETGGCFLLDTNPRAWDAASANCQELGGQLTSINSPARQAQIFEMIGFDPTASAGKNSNLFMVHIIQHMSWDYLNQT